MLTAVADCSLPICAIRGVLPSDVWSVMLGHQCGTAVFFNEIFHYSIFISYQVA
jgi:hypothetical protein